MTPMKCQDCGEPAGDFQCPLCQAEGFTDKGFYCSQECFTKNWLEHRNTIHKGGSVREKKKPEKTEKSDGASPSKGSKTSKRARDDEDTEEAVGGKPVKGTRTHVMPWPALPNVSACRGKSCLATTPSFLLHTPKALLVAEESCTSTATAFWPLVISAAGITAAAIAQDATLKVLVVAGSPQSAHAFAWAARCAGLSGQLRLAVSDYDHIAAPEQHFTRGRHVVIATRYVVEHTGGATAAGNGAAGAAALWIPQGNALLVTLPDVSDAEDLQGVHQRALFCAYRHKKAASSFDDAANWSVRAEADDELPPLFVAHPFAATAGTPPLHEDGSALTWTSLTAPAQLLNGRALTGRLDNEVSTALANGEIIVAIEQLIRVYGAMPGYFEEILLNSLACDWAAMSITHAHHRLAYAARVLAGQTREYDAVKGASIAAMTFRALVPLCRLLPSLGASTGSAAGVPLQADEVAADNSTASKSKSKKAKTEAKKQKEEAAAAPSSSSTAAAIAKDLVPSAAIQDESIEPATPADVQKYWNYYHTGCRPNLQLQATLHHWMDSPAASTIMLDALAECWGVTRCLEGGPTVALHAANKARQDIVQRLNSRYHPRLGDDGAAFMVMLMHFVYDAVAIYSLTEQDLEERVLWNLTLAHEAGTLSAFLGHCQLLHEAIDLKKQEEAQEKKSKAKPTLSSRGADLAKKPVSRTERLRVLPVRAASVDGFVSLKWRGFPLSGERQREIEKLHHLAVEEVLMAMPTKPRPMYVGEIGNLVGKWFRFNARYDGVLGVTLQDFLMQHPEAFTVAGLLITRRKAGRGDQVRIRFDEDDYGGRDEDSDDDEARNRSRKARDREMLTGGKRKTAKQKQAELEKNLPSRARKRLLVKAFNQSRFDRNYKPIDPSARVPGYIKRPPRVIKGRGKKANKRTTKRS